MKIYVSWGIILLMKLAFLVVGWLILSYGQKGKKIIVVGIMLQQKY